jgi:hypothetical protein
MSNEPEPTDVQIRDGKALLEISRGFEDHRIRREQVWYGYQDGDSWGAIPFVNALFRGQNKRHGSMLPSIARGLESTTGDQLWEKPPLDQARIILRLAQSWWFAREIDYHPISAHAAEQKLKLDRIALAQHYGIPTGYLDLTDDFNVAGFFAACRPCKSSDGWEPVEEGVGIIYRVDLDGAGLDNPFGRYMPIGPQILPRPTEQCGWVTELPLVPSFDGWPGVMQMQFHQERAIGEHFLDLFHGGWGLFPPDPLADVANEIMACQEVPSVFIEEGIKSFAEDPAGIRPDQVSEVRRELSKLIAEIDYRRLLTEEQVSGLTADFEWRKRMLSEAKVNWRLVRSVPVSVSDESDAAIEPPDATHDIDPQELDTKSKG